MKIEKIRVDENQGKLAEHLENYRAKTLEMGAANAAVIDVDSIPVDDRVLLKCQIPRCFGYGCSAHCPPHSMKPAELRENLKNYNRAVVFTVDVEPEVIVRAKATIKERIAAYMKVFKIVSAIENMAYYDGHYFAFGFGAGSCRHSYCSREETCAAMEGKKCRFNLFARPSMEAVGIDALKLVAAQGWDIYPIGSGTKAESIPKGVLVGILIVQ